MSRLFSPFTIGFGVALIPAAWLYFSCQRHTSLDHTRLMCSLSRHSVWRPCGLSLLSALLSSPPSLLLAPPLPLCCVPSPAYKSPDDRVAALHKHGLTSSPVLPASNSASNQMLLNSIFANRHEKDLYTALGEKDRKAPSLVPAAVRIPTTAVTNNPATEPAFAPPTSSPPLPPAQSSAAAAPSH